MDSSLYLAFWSVSDGRVYQSLFMVRTGKECGEISKAGSNVEVTPIGIALVCTTTTEIALKIDTALDRSMEIERRLIGSSLNGKGEISMSIDGSVEWV